jgi:hypothetical protein
MPYSLASTSNKYHPIAEIRKLLPGAPHISTIHRWMLRGVRGIKLETVLIGGRRYVSDEALNEFLRLINANDTSTGPASSVTVDTTSNLRQAEAVLDREGV